MQTRINYPQGFAFISAGLMLGGLMIVAALFVLLFKPYIMLVPDTAWTRPIALLVGLTGGLLFSCKGVLIDKTANTVFSYYVIYGIRVGKKRSLSDFNCVTITRQGYARQAVKLNEEGTFDRYEVFDVMMVSQNMEQEQVIRTSPSLVDAKGEALELSDLLEFRIVEYFFPGRSKES
ncbi:MAG: hypothetical protein ACJ76F_13285 [Bacteroidia bacterium]